MCGKIRTVATLRVGLALLRFNSDAPEPGKPLFALLLGGAGPRSVDLDAMAFAVARHNVGLELVNASKPQWKDKDVCAFTDPYELHRIEWRRVSKKDLPRKPTCTLCCSGVCLGSWRQHVQCYPVPATEQLCSRLSGVVWMYAKLEGLYVRNADRRGRGFDLDLKWPRV